MPPKQTTGAGRGRAKASKATPAAGNESDSSNPFESSGEKTRADTTQNQTREEEDEGGELEKSIPRDLLTRVLHEFFAKDSTRISRDANAAVGKYVDIFVREAIARAAVEDLEKIAPQLLLDL
ncbi:hypothetical protein PT974_02581 [Cladobotryum mycophilum]|uniref:Centromere protein X n=1 Tax=Cladobotryum mycophilum TaxID=491253 RepID=A0ABR0SYH1_9HYPO